MTIDWGKVVRDVVDLGSETYERRVARTALKVGAIALFVVVFGVLVLKK